MTNFSYLTSSPAYALFAPAAVEAEKVYAASSAMCAVEYRIFIEIGQTGNSDMCASTEELFVRWLYDFF